jgi:pantothenate kinase
MHYALTSMPGECYTYRYEGGEEKDVKEKEKWRKDVKEYTMKIPMPYEDFASRNSFPYLVVNIGSGVSILKVKAPNDFERVSGSAIGGGTYWGLCRLLLTQCSSYETAMDLAEKGEATQIDMLVGDIYGGGCTYSPLVSCRID